MERRPLGRSGLTVSVIGLGTMTWGEQNTEAEAHAQLDLALDHGVNLVDVAEMYPVPPRPETQGLTETFLGTWLARTGRRRDVVLATKMTGPGRAFAHIRGGSSRFVRTQLEEACNASLTRLQTDHIDLYQLHWPDRSTNVFGALEYRHNPRELATPIDETLAALDALIQAGKIGHVGVSNETPWGLHAFLSAAERGLPRVVSIQNPYNLLNRTFEIGHAEFSHRSAVPLLAYSPLAMGVLSGKFEGGRTWPPGARLTRFERFRRYCTPRAFRASEAYVAIAAEHGLDPAQLALAWTCSRPFLASCLIGATSEAQLRANLDAGHLTLPDAVHKALDAVHTADPNPAP
jgi:aryl-alcohol dehydrogenase-like predicted oxidoreductase